MALELVIDSDQRAGFLGQTGMGKTFLVERTLDQQPRVVVVDSKHRVNWKGYHLTENPVAALLADKTIYRPQSNGRPPNEWWWEAVQTLHERGGGVIYIDELSVVCDSGRIPDGLAKAMRLGRELGVGVWFSAQESTTVHNTALRQAEILVMFYNQGESDREKLSRIVGDMAFVTAYLPEYEFVVFVRGETYDHDAVETFKAVP